MAPKVQNKFIKNSKQKNNNININKFKTNKTAYTYQVQLNLDKLKNNKLQTLNHDLTNINITKH